MKLKRYIPAFAAILIFAVLLCSCGKNPEQTAQPSTTLIPPPVTNTEGSNITQLGSGKNGFYLKIDNNGVSEFFIHTDEKTVGDALEKIGMISGTDGEYVEIVNSFYADYYQKDNHWAFYVNGKPEKANVKSVEITENSEYLFKSEK